jgi:hypothetical protein
MFERLDPQALELVQKYIISRIDWQVSRAEEVDVHMYEDLGRIAYELLKRQEEGQNPPKG